MSLISARVHGILDYVTVAGFLVAPTVLGFTDRPAALCYALAAVHLLMTLATAFPLGIVKAVSFRLHGGVELAVSIALVVLPWILGFGGFHAARYFFYGAAAVIFLVWLLTGYGAHER